MNGCKENIFCVGYVNVSRNVSNQTNSKKNFDIKNANITDNNWKMLSLLVKKRLWVHRWDLGLTADINIVGEGPEAKSIKTISIGFSILKLPTPYTERINNASWDFKLYDCGLANKLR